MNRRWILPAVFTVAAVFGYACGTDQTVGSRFVKSELVSASRGGDISVAPIEEPALAGAQLSVPPNALAKDSRLTLELGLTDVSSAPRGPVAIWGPSGTLFSTPAKLTLPLTLSNPDEVSAIEIVVEEADGSRFTIPNTELTIDAAGRFVTFPVKGFTRFQPGVAPARDAGSAGGGNAAGGAAAGGGAAISCRSDADCPATHQCALRVPAQPGTCVLRPATGGGVSGTGGGVSGTGGGNATLGCANNSQCAPSQTCVIRVPGTPGVCVGGGTGGGNPGTGGGVSGTGGGTSGTGGGNTVLGCANNAQCASGQICVIRVPGTLGMCVAGGTGGGGAGTGGGVSGTGGGNPATGGGSAPTPCRTPQECQSPLQCINFICQ